MHVKRGDNIIVLAGKDRGKTGKIDKVLVKENKVIVSGINISKSHQKPKRGGEKGQVVEISMPMHVSNVRLAGEEKKAKPAPKKEDAEPKVKKAKKTEKVEK